MKVRILSGNAQGQLLEMPEIEAQNAIATGYAEVVDPAVEAHEKADVEVHKKAARKADRDQERADRAADDAAEERAEDLAASHKRGR